MAQEAVTEIDMDVFSRRIGPYFTWLESKIESGWEQSESVTKDLLKETKYLATQMRARFILGVSKEDFTREVQRTLELFELATEAFSAESDEIENKIKHFTKGISEELGSQFIPQDYQTPRPPQPPEPHPMPIPNPEPDPMPEPEEEKITKPTIKIEKPAKMKIEVKIEKPKIQKITKPALKIEKPKIQKAKKAMPRKAPKPIKSKPTQIQKITKQSTVKTPAKKTKKQFSVLGWIKDAIYGDEDM